MKTSKAKVIVFGMLLILLLLLVGENEKVLALHNTPEPPLVEIIGANSESIMDFGDRVEGSWWDGQIQYTNVINFQGTLEYGFGAVVGYWQNVEQGHPLVGERYLVKVAVYGVGSPASGDQAAAINFILPPSTQIDSGYPVRCFGGSDMLEFTEGCPQSLPYNPLNNWFSIPSNQEGNVFPIAPGAGWEFWIPVTTSTQLTGVDFIGVIDNLEAMNTPGILYPTVPIYVFSGSTPNPGGFNKIFPADDAFNIPFDTYLEWGDSYNVSTYEYCIDTSNDNACAPWVDYTIPYNLLSPGTTYYWHIRAVNSAGVTYSDGSPTAFWSFTTEEAANPPGAFNKSSPPNGVTDLPTNLTLTWGESSSVSKYEYCYDTSDDNNCTNWMDNGMSTSKSLSSLAADTTYYWHVRAVNDEGTTYANGSSIAFWSFRTEEPVSPPGTFSKAVPANGEADVSTSPTLYWGTSSGASSYEYCYDTTNDNACANWVNNGSSTSKSLSGLSNNTTYYWHVRARNTNGVTHSNGSSIAFWSFKTLDSTSPPGNFSKTRPWDGTTDLPSELTLYWNISSGATSYEYCFDTTNDNTCAGWVNNGIARTKTLSGLLPGTTYYWQVRARNSDGVTYANGSPTAYWSLKTLVPISADDGVLAMAVQADGKILIGGYFTYVNEYLRPHIARLHSDGSIDGSFGYIINGRVDAIAIQPDGKILIGGDFTEVGSYTCSHIARLNTNGTVDTTFNASANSPVYAILVQPDNKILIGGSFTEVGTETRTYLARLNANGSIDSSFANITLDNIVRTLAIQEDEKILIGGAFKYVDSVKRTFIARLYKDGILDETFNPVFDNYLMNLVIQPDGKILVGGQFSKVNGEVHEHITRITPSGGLDKYFFAQANDSVVSIALQADGKMIIGGYFTEVNSDPHNHIVRLDSEGNVDISLSLGANGLVTGIGLQSNGRILVGGLFTRVNDEDHNYIARLKNNSTATQSLSVSYAPSGDLINWSLGNSSPDVYRVTFEQSTNGSGYTFLGDGDYVMGKWILDGLDLPGGQVYWVRARGYYGTGCFNGSGSILETVIKIKRLFLPVIFK